MGQSGRPPSYLSQHRRSPQNVAADARDVVKAVRALIEEERKKNNNILCVYISLTLICV